MYCTPQAIISMFFNYTLAGSQTTVLVECGVFTRPVSFNSSEDSMQFLTNAIVASFPGLREEYIAVLKTQSELYGGRYVDIINPNFTVDSGSFIKVVVRSKVFNTLQWKV